MASGSAVSFRLITENTTEGRTHSEIKLSLGHFELEMFEGNRQKFQLRG